MLVHVLKCLAASLVLSVAACSKSSSEPAELAKTGSVDIDTYLEAFKAELAGIDSGIEVRHATFIAHAAAKNAKKVYQSQSLAVADGSDLTATIAAAAVTGAIESLSEIGLPLVTIIDAVPRIVRASLQSLINSKVIDAADHDTMGQVIGGMANGAAVALNGAGVTEFDDLKNLYARIAQTTLSILEALSVDLSNIETMFSDVMGALGEGIYLSGMPANQIAEFMVAAQEGALKVMQDNGATDAEMVLLITAAAESGMTNLLNHNGSLPEATQFIGPMTNGLALAAANLGFSDGKVEGTIMGKIIIAMIATVASSPQMANLQPGNTSDMSMFSKLFQPLHASLKLVLEENSDPKSVYTQVLIGLEGVRITSSTWRLSMGEQFLREFAETYDLEMPENLMEPMPFFGENRVSLGALTNAQWKVGSFCSRIPGEVTTLEFYKPFLTAGYAHFCSALGGFDCASLDKLVTGGKFALKNDEKLVGSQFCDFVAD